MKKVGNIWQKLDGKGRERFENEAKVDKLRFLKEMREFQKDIERSAFSDLSQLHKSSKNKEKSLPKNTPFTNQAQTKPHLKAKLSKRKNKNSNLTEFKEDLNCGKSQYIQK